VLLVSHDVEDVGALRRGAGRQGERGGSGEELAAAGSYDRCGLVHCCSWGQGLILRRSCTISLPRLTASGGS
jgi:hypothetical protein